MELTDVDRAILMAAYKDELTAIRSYEELYSRFRLDEEIASKLREIIADEKKHADMLAMILGIETGGWIIKH
jgi:rubrerythrin